MNAERVRQDCLRALSQRTVERGLRFHRHAFSSLYEKTDKIGASKVMGALGDTQLNDPSVAAYYGLFLAAVGEKQRRGNLKIGASAKLLPEERTMIAEAERSSKGRTKTTRPFLSAWPPQSNGSQAIWMPWTGVGDGPQRPLPQWPGAPRGAGWPLQEWEQSSPERLPVRNPPLPLPLR